MPHYLKFISGVMKLASILSRPVKRKDRLGLVVAATLGDQRKKQNNCFLSTSFNKVPAYCWWTYPFNYHFIQNPRTKLNQFCSFLQFFCSLLHYSGKLEGREGDEGWVGVGEGGGEFEGGEGDRGGGGEHLLPVPLFWIWLSHCASCLLWHDWKASASAIFASSASTPPTSAS